MPVKTDRDRRRINLRVDERQRSLIDRAARAVGKTHADFVLDAACREATVVLLDRRLFLLDKETFRRFTAALDKSRPDPRLRHLLAVKAPWDR